MSSVTALDIKPAMWKKYRPFSLSQARKELPSAIDEAHTVAKKLAEELINRFGAKNVFLFGSLARGDFSKWSDIDMAVRGIPSKDFYRAVAFASGFSKVWKIDLVDTADCSEDLQGIILKEGIRL